MSMLSVTTKNRLFYSSIFCLFFKITSLSAQCLITTQPSNATTCSGGNAAFTIVTSGNITGFQWQINTGSGFNNISDNAVFSGSSTATLTLTGVNSENDGYSFQCLVYNGCGGDIPSDIKTLTITPNTWTGATNSDWHTASNWSCGVVPTNHDDVNIDVDFLIPTPVIAPNAQAYCRNITLNAFFDVLSFAGATLNVSGDMTYMGGSFATNNSSFLLFNGNKTQHLNDGWLIVPNLTLTNSQNLIVNNANITVSNTLKLNAGKIILGNNILVVNTISAASDTRFVCTCDELGTPSVNGGIRKTIVANANFTFPIGSSLTSYNPITISNTSGPNETFKVFVDNSPLAGANATEVVQRTWHVEETTAGGNTASMTLQWDASHEGGSFDHSSAICRVLKSNGTDLDYTGYSLKQVLPRILLELLGLNLWRVSPAFQIGVLQANLARLQLRFNRVMPRLVRGAILLSQLRQRVI